MSATTEGTWPVIFMPVGCWRLADIQASGQFTDVVYPASMFTGLIEDVGTVAAVERMPEGARLSVRTRLPGLTHGASIAVDGVCLTAVELAGDRFTGHLSPGTLSKSAMGERKAGDRVAVERPLDPGARLGGHLV